MNWHEEASQLGLDSGLLNKLEQLHTLQNEVGRVSRNGISSVNAHGFFSTIAKAESNERTR